jgi:hypothetical protein
VWYTGYISKEYTAVIFTRYSTLKLEAVSSSEILVPYITTKRHGVTMPVLQTAEDNTLPLSFLAVTFLDLISRVCLIVSHDYNLANSCTDIKQRLQYLVGGGGGGRFMPLEFRHKK